MDFGKWKVNYYVILFIYDFDLSPSDRLWGTWGGTTLLAMFLIGKESMLKEEVSIGWLVK